MLSSCWTAPAEPFLLDPDLHPHLSWVLHQLDHKPECWQHSKTIILGAWQQGSQAAGSRPMVPSMLQHLSKADSFGTVLRRVALLDLPMPS